MLSLVKCEEIRPVSKQRLKCIRQTNPGQARAAFQWAGVS